MGKLQVRRGDKLDLPNPLDSGEFGWANDSEQLYIGTGVANSNVFIGGSAATADFKVYLATSALGATALSGGATGLVIESGTTTGTTASKLVNGNATFTSAILNKTVYNTTDNTWAKVTAVDSGTVLSLSADIMASGETYDIADAVDDLEDAYSLVPNPYTVNITVAVSPGTFTYAGAVTLGGKSASGAVVLTMQGGATTTTIESTTTTTLTFGDIITVDDITFSDPIVYSSNAITSDCAYVGNLTTNGTLTGTTLNIDGNLVTVGVATLTTSDVAGTLTSTGAITLNTTDVDGNVTSNGAFTNTTSITIGGTFDVFGTCTLDTATITGNTVCYATISNVTSLSITGNFTNNGVASLVDVDIGGNLTVNAEFTSTTDLDVTGDITTNAKTVVAGSVTCDNITTSGGALTQTGTLTVTTNATFNGEVTVTDISVGGDLEANSKFTEATDLDVTGSATFNGETTLDGTVSCGVDFTIGGSLTQTGTLSITNDAVFSGDSSVTDIDVGGDLTANVAFTSVTDIDVTGSMTFSGVTAIAGTITCGGNFTLNGTLTQTGSLAVTGTLDTFGTADVTNLTITGDSDFAGTLRLTGTNVFNGDVYARKRFEVAGTTFNMNVYAEFGCDGVWDTCTITSPFKLYIQSNATANTIEDSTLTIANDPTGIININSTITDGYTFYVATSALGGDDATATGLEVFNSSATSTSANKLVDTGASFNDAEHLNKTVWNDTDDTWAKVSAVDSATQLSLSVDIMVSGDTYKIVDAFATVQKGVDSIPGSVNCDTTVKISDGTFAEYVTVQGKGQTGSFFVEIIGTKDIKIDTRNVTAAADKTCTIDGAALTVNAHKDEIIKLVSGTGSDPQQEGLILSNTASVITLVGAWKYGQSFIDVGDYTQGVNPDATTDIIIYSQKTIINQIRITGGQQSVRLHGLKLIAPLSSLNGAVQVDNLSSAEVYGCYIDIGTTPGRMIYVASGSVAGILNTFWTSTTDTRLCQFEKSSTVIHHNSAGERRIAIAFASNMNFIASRIDTISANRHGIQANCNSYVALGFDARSGSVLTGASGTGYDLNVGEGSGVTRRTNVNNTITTFTVDAATYSWTS